MMIEKGKKVRIHYTLRVDGSVIDTSDGREPLEYTHGKGEIIVGLERQLEGHDVGDECDITVSPEDAYGMEDPEAFVEVPKEKLPEGDIVPGMQFLVTRQDGSQIPVTISQIKDESVILNLNHPLAGKQLMFNIVIVEVQEQ